MSESMLAPSMPEHKSHASKKELTRRERARLLKPIDPIDQLEEWNEFGESVKKISPKSFRKKKEDTPLTPAETYDEFDKWSADLRRELMDAKVLDEPTPEKKPRQKPLDSLRRMGFETPGEKIEREQKSLNTKSEKVIIDDKVATLRKQIEKPQDSTEGVTKMLNEQISELNRREGIQEEKKNLILSKMGRWTKFKNFLAGLTGGIATSPEMAELEQIETSLEGIRSTQNALREELQLISYGENKGGRSKAENTVEKWADEGHTLKVKDNEGFWRNGMVMNVGRDGMVELSVEGGLNAKFYTMKVPAKDVVAWQSEKQVNPSFVKKNTEVAKDVLRDVAAIAPGTRSSMERDQDLVEASQGVKLSPDQFTNPEEFDKEIEKGLEEPIDTSFVKTKRRAAKDMLRDAAAIMPGVKTSQERDQERADDKLGISLPASEFTNAEAFEANLSDENRENRKRAGEGMTTDQAAEALGKSVARKLWDKANKGLESNPTARGFIAMKNAAINEYPATMYVYEVAKALNAKRDKDTEMFNIAVGHIKEWNDMLGIKDDVVESIISAAPEKKSKKDSKK